MTPATVRDLPDDTRRGECWLCGQHLSDGLHIEPLNDAEDLARFKSTHQVEDEP